MTNIHTTVQLGIDVSKYQGAVDWNQVHNSGGKVFALIRATAGINTTDSQFSNNIVAAKNAGLLVGAYHLAYPQYFTAQQEAQKFLSVARAYIGAGYLPPALDIEDSPSDNSYPYQMGSAALSQWITNWCAIVQQASGIKPVIYSTRDYARNYFETYVNQYPYWVVTDSGVSNSDPGNMGIWSTWLFQQYEYGGSGGTCPGVTGAVDLDSFNGDLAALQALTNRTAAAAPAITSPAPGSTFTSSSVTFQWSSGSGVTDYFLYVGSSLGTNDIYGQDQGLSHSVTVNNLPENGSTLYVRLWWEISGVWYAADYTYTAYTSSTVPIITSPTPGSTLTSSSVAFQWSDGSGVSDYFLYVGSSLGTNDIYGQDQGLNQSVTVNNLPENGSTLYVRLWWEISSVWYYTDYTYTANSSTSDTTPPTLTIASPINGATVTSASLSVSGTATDNGNGNDGVSSVTVNGVTANNDTASGSGTAEWDATISLNAGLNTVTVIAKDTLGNQVSLQRTVTYNPPQPVFGGSSINGNNLQMTLTGLSSREKIVLEVSSDMKNWTPVQTNTVNGSTQPFTFSINPDAKSQFFRARVQ